MYQRQYCVRVRALNLHAEPLPELHMLREEEPEQQLQDVSEAQVAEHHAAKKAAADKAAGTTAGGLGKFAGAKAGPSKQAAADAHKQAGAGGSAAAAKQPGGASSADAVQRSASEAGAAPATLSHTQLRTLHVERQHLLGECQQSWANFAWLRRPACTCQPHLSVAAWQKGSGERDQQLTAGCSQHAGSYL